MEKYSGKKIAIAEMRRREQNFSVRCHFLRVKERWGSKAGFKRMIVRNRRVMLKKEVGGA